MGEHELMTPVMNRLTWNRQAGQPCKGCNTVFKNPLLDKANAEEENTEL